MSCIDFFFAFFKKIGSWVFIRAGDFSFERVKARLGSENSAQPYSVRNPKAKPHLQSLMFAHRAFSLQQLRARARKNREVNCTITHRACHMVRKHGMLHGMKTGQNQGTKLGRSLNSIINSILAFPTFLVGNVYGMPHGRKTGHATWQENKVQLGHITGYCLNSTISSTLAFSNLPSGECLGYATWYENRAEIRHITGQAP